MVFTTGDRNKLFGWRPSVSLLGGVRQCARWRCKPLLGGGVNRRSSCAILIDRVYSKYTMPTSVHIPKPLLVAVDRRARALKISRNRLIVQALEREITEGSNWSPDFFGQLESAETGVEDAAGEMLKAIQSQRRSKKPVRL